MNRFTLTVLLLFSMLAGSSHGAAALCYWSLSNDGDPDTGPLIIRVHWESGYTTCHGQGDSLPVGCNVSHYTVCNVRAPGDPPLGDLGVKASPPGCRGGAPVNIGGVFVNGGVSEGVVVSLSCTGCGSDPADCDECGPGTADIDCDDVPNETDPDIDGDGTPNGEDPDIDGDGIPNNEDTDDDGDGVPDDEDDEPCGDGVDPCFCAPESPACDDCDEATECCEGEPGYPECDDCDELTECCPGEPGYPDCCNPLTDCCEGEAGYPDCCHPDVECCPEEEGYPDCPEEDCEDCICDKLDEVLGVLNSIESGLGLGDDGGYTPVMPTIDPVLPGSPPDGLGFDGAENVLPSTLPEWGSPTGGHLTIPVPGIDGEGVSLSFGARPLEDFAQPYLGTSLGTVHLAIDNLRQAVRLILLLLVSWSFCRRVYAQVLSM